MHAALIMNAALNMHHTIVLLVLHIGQALIDCPRSFCLVKSRGLAHLAALGL